MFGEFWNGCRGLIKFRTTGLGSEKLGVWNRLGRAPSGLLAFCGSDLKKER